MMKLAAKRHKRRKNLSPLNTLKTRNIPINRRAGDCAPYPKKTMNKSESITHLAAALAQAQAEMPVAVFDATNPFLKSKYASLGSVIQASRPILAKHKLSLVQFPISDAIGIGVESVLSHESGEFVAERIVIPLSEEKGKTKV